MLATVARPSAICTYGSLTASMRTTRTVDRIRRQVTTVKMSPEEKLRSSRILCILRVNFKYYLLRFILEVPKANIVVSHLFSSTRVVADVGMCGTQYFPYLVLC
jgi:hypothetical protein